MAMLKGAIETIYVPQRERMTDSTAMTQRSDRIEGVQERDRAMTRTELPRIGGENPTRANAAVDVKLRVVHLSPTQ